MKILTVGYLHGAGGAERQIILLSNQMARRGNDVTLCVLSEFKSNYSIDDAVHVVDLTNVEGGLLRILRRFWVFKKLVISIHPDVIINYNLQSAYFCLAISKNERGKVVYSERGDPYDAEYSGILGKVRDWTVPRMDGVVFQSEGARDFFDERVRKKSIVIHNSVNVPQDKFPIPIEREKRIVNVGRLHPQKNQRLLIDAFSNIASKYPDYYLDIYGDGLLQEELLNHIEELGLSGRIRIYPSRKDIWKIIYKAALFVLSSDYEGMPNALMEAMALGMPCVSTDCRPGGARSLIENGVNGYIVPRNDSRKLAECMDFVLSNTYVAKSIALEARRLQKTHSDMEIFNKWDLFLKHM